MERDNHNMAKKGFTFADLMVVVAIIGLFSGVAIPNFVYYKANSKVSEARLQLASAYMAQSTMFSDFNTYAGCLYYMGYNPIADKPERHYVVGFNVDTIVPNNSYQSAVKAGLKAMTFELINGTKVTADCPQKIPAATDGVNYFSAGKAVLGFIADKDHLSNTSFDSVTGKKFTIGAAGVIDARHHLPGTSSLLTINEKKVVNVVRKGF